MKKLGITLLVLPTVTTGSVLAVKLSAAIYTDLQYHKQYVDSQKNLDKAKKEIEIQSLQINMLMAKLSEQRLALETVLKNTPVLEPRSIKEK